MTTAVHAIILLSGGMDSATCLSIARSQQRICHTLAFDYGQRHRQELSAAQQLSQVLGASDHRLITLDTAAFAGSALTDPSIALPTTPSESIPATYVPARNTVFLAMALAYAEVRAAEEIWIGVNAIDYSGYPDCRPEFIDAFARMAALANRTGIAGQPIRIVAPLQHCSKAEIIRQGTRLGIDYSLTISCYQADSQGLACGQCDACRLRHQGFVDATIADNTRYLPSVPVNSLNGMV